MSNKPYIISFFLFIIVSLGLGIWSFINMRDDSAEVIKKVTVSGAKLLETDRYLKDLNLPPEKDLQGFTPSELRLRLLKHPYIKEVHITFSDDYSAEVELVEEEIFAILRSETKSYFVTEEFKMIEVLPGTLNVDYPIITNSTIKIVKNLERNVSHDLMEAHDIIKVSDAIGKDFSDKISEINLRDGSEIVLTISDLSPLVLFGHDNIARKMLYLKEFRNKKEFEKDFVKSFYLDLRYPEFIFLGSDEKAEIEGNG